MKQEKQKTDLRKRQQIIKTLAVGGLAVTAWHKPVVSSIVLPAHAQTSPGTTTTTTTAPTSPTVTEIKRFQIGRARLVQFQPPGHANYTGTVSMERGQGDGPNRLVVDLHFQNEKNLRLRWARINEATCNELGYPSNIFDRSLRQFDGKREILDVPADKNAIVQVNFMLYVSENAAPNQDNDADTLEDKENAFYLPCSELSNGR